MSKLFQSEFSNKSRNLMAFIWTFSSYLIRKADDFSCFEISGEHRDVTTGVTGMTLVAPKFSDSLTLHQPRGADSAPHCRGRS